MARPERDVIYGAGLTFLIQSGTLITDENLRQEISRTASWDPTGRKWGRGLAQGRGLLGGLISQ